MNIKKMIHGAFGRSSAAIGLVIVVAFTVMILSTAYHMLAFSPAEFMGRPDTREYENAVENVSAMDEWTRTKYYWSNNLGVAGMVAVWTPMYFGFNTVVATNYSIGISLTYYHHLFGASGGLAFSAEIFVHGLLELTGVYIITAASMRVAWNLWKGLAHLMTMAGKGGRWSWGLSRREKREILKHKSAIRLLAIDFVMLFAVGTFLIFLAAPIEAYVSPTMVVIFYSGPVLAVAFLAAVAALFSSIVKRSFGAMRGSLRLVWEDARSATRGKWRPAQFSILMFAIFFSLALLQLMF